ncbi:hypothetical protein PR048_006747 [Dryococelus australis]|uniref:Recombination activating protein 2 n=1 Tax=Dryococelus australis TaxID=614101 RepID=A0ABQ9IBS8_9NEOP|nr:hypothetical protein PR048_006747 [Dryococelus australis]
MSRAVRRVILKGIVAVEETDGRLLLTHPSPHRLYAHGTLLACSPSACNPPECSDPIFHVPLIKWSGTIMPLLLPSKANLVRCGNRAGRCHWLADFFEDLSFPPPFRSGAAPYSPRFTMIGSQDLDVLWVGEGEAAPECQGRENGISEKTHRTGGIVRYDYHMRKSRHEPAGNQTHFALMGGKRSICRATAVPQKEKFTASLCILEIGGVCFFHPSHPPHLLAVENAEEMNA